MEYRFTMMVDSTASLPEEWHKGKDVFYLPHATVIDGKENWDNFGKDMPEEKIYAYIRAGGMPSTAQGSQEEIYRFFEESGQKGLDALYIGFSSGLTGTYGTAMTIISELSEKYPERKFVCFDSLAASSGHALLAIYAQQMRENGATIDEAVAALTERRLNVCHFFTVDDLNHLYRGGRLSKTAALVGTLVGIKPVLYVNEQGRLVPLGKKRGRRAAMEELARLAAEYISEDRTVYIMHGDCLDEAKQLAKILLARVPDARIDYTMISPTIAVHAGPGTLAVVFWGKKRL